MTAKSTTTQSIDLLADDDLVALPFDAYVASSPPGENAESSSTSMQQMRLCVIRNSEYIYPLIRHEDDVETDLFLDPRHMEEQILLTDLIKYYKQQIPSEQMIEVPYYGVGWYGQRPVPSLGGGPGYGAEADEVWSIEEDVLEALLEEGEVEIPVIDVGMAHGEKARGGALF